MVDCDILIFFQSISTWESPKLLEEDKLFFVDMFRFSLFNDTGTYLHKLLNGEYPLLVITISYHFITDDWWNIYHLWHERKTYIHLITLQELDFVIG